MSADRTYTLSPSGISAGTALHSFHAAGTADVVSNARLPISGAVSTDGFEWMTFTHTARSATAVLEILIQVIVGHPSITGGVGSILLMDSDTIIKSAVFSDIMTNSSASNVLQLSYVHRVVPGDTSAHTYRVRLGRSTSTVVTVTAFGSNSTYFPGDLVTGCFVKEYEP